MVQGYDSGLVILKALEQSGGDARPDRLIPILEKLKIESPRGTFEFDEQHEGVYPMYVVEIRMVGGKATPVVIENMGRIKTPNMGCTLLK
ncbi:MAG: ABC transporter substrate-binding protein [Deltaproteobacteria bacterium]|nr:ABC transporter substrate-binding protein [Deltaproteobacteria bacterium]